MSSSSQKSMAVLRIGMFLFMMVWALEKIIKPESFQGIFSKFYGVEVGVLPIYLIGAVQIGILLLFVAGKFKTASYGLIMVMNVISLLVSYRQILDPYGGPGNHLFAASIVVAAASIALFLGRSDDSFMTLENPDATASASDLQADVPTA